METDARSSRGRFVALPGLMTGKRKTSAPDPTAKRRRKQKEESHEDPPDSPEELERVASCEEAAGAGEQKMGIGNSSLFGF